MIIDHLVLSQDLYFNDLEIKENVCTNTLSKMSISFSFVNYSQAYFLLNNGLKLFK